MVKEKVIWSLSSLSFADFLCLFFKHSGHTNIWYIYLIISLIHMHFMHACVCFKLDWMIIDIPFFKKWTNERCPLKQKLVVGEDASPRHQATLLGPPFFLIVFSLISNICSFSEFTIFMPHQRKTSIINLNHSYCEWIHSLQWIDSPIGSQYFLWFMITTMVSLLFIIYIFILYFESMWNQHSVSKSKVSKFK